MNIIYVRHGETDWNSEKKLQGSTDIPLNGQGILQAEETERLLAGEKFDRIVCSPLERAKRTAEIINRKRGVPLIVDERIRERGFGDLEGKPYSQEDFNLWWKKDFDFEKHGMESVGSLLERTKLMIDELKRKYPTETVLIVSHGGSFVAVDSYFNGYPDDSQTLRFIPNCTVRKFSCED